MTVLIERHLQKFTLFHNSGEAKMNEPLVKTRPIKITPTTSPAPPWSGMVFNCARCEAENQLEAGDVCIPLSPDGRDYLTPACPTPGCGHISVVTLPRPAAEVRKQLQLGLEWNPS
jgi:hypothetical protein